jgi:HSP20 family protein
LLVEPTKEVAMLTRWNDLGFGDLDQSFAALTGLRQEMDRLFQRFEHEWGGDSSQFTPRALDSSQPALLIRDTGEELLVTAEVPGFSPEDLHVSMEQGSLIVRGERRDDTPEGYSVHRKERGALRFARAFALPARVEADKIKATLRNGILELRLPKAAEERPRTISVKAA